VQEAIHGHHACKQWHRYHTLLAVPINAKAILLVFSSYFIKLMPLALSTFDADPRIVVVRDKLIFS
jgi:hypothetical protein